MRLSAQGGVLPRIEILTYFVYAPFSIRGTACPERLSTIFDIGFTFHLSIGNLIFLEGVNAMTIRIIGGELKSRKLVTVSGRQTRPTADRVRESIFNILGDRVPNALVLDLFAGTGAMGIEALSRGAESVLFADNDKRALTALEKNVKACSLESRAKIIKWNILKNLNITRSFQHTFNLVFIDPPYNQNLIEPTLLNLGKSQCIENGACVAIEHSPQEPIPEKDERFKISNQRRYGKTLVSFLFYML
jgi:16S rRNA (guanine966-N2)-methyltransferase